MGGLNLLDLKTETGITSIQWLCNAIYKDNSAGRLMTLNTQPSQLESGRSTPLLEQPNILIPYLTQTWITSIRRFLQLHNIQITLNDTLCPHYRGAKQDACTMDHPSLSQYTIQQQMDINYVRLHLQVWTLSDMSIVDGKNIHHTYLDGTRATDEAIFKDNLAWPRQPTITPTQRRLWKKIIQSSFI